MARSIKGFICRIVGHRWVIVSLAVPVTIQCIDCKARRELHWAATERRLDDDD